MGIANTAEEAAPAPFAGSAIRLDKYWYQGKGELSSYELIQNRYTDLHPGTALLIFVTEDFLTGPQVKNERYRDENSTLVLKTNFIRKFTTGLYDYSLMSSVFTPANTDEFPHTLKVSTSVQDWCGHAYSQINWTDEGYQQQMHSYFESEADRVETAPGVVLEDELFNRIRLDWTRLPEGQIDIIPSQTYLRLRHRPYMTYRAEVRLQDYNGSEFTGSALKSYQLQFPTENRTLEIIFNSEPPFLIEGWIDTYPSMDGQERSTIAKRKETILEDYWSHHDPVDRALRTQLDL